MGLRVGDMVKWRKMWIKKKLAAKRTPPYPPRVSEQDILDPESWSLVESDDAIVAYVHKLMELKKTATTFYIRVDKCSGDYWYKDCVGQTFEVVDKGNSHFDYSWVSGDLPTRVTGISYACPLFQKSDVVVLLKPKHKVKSLNFN